jgi:hypothetical protein
MVSQGTGLLKVMDVVPALQGIGVGLEGKLASE